MTVVSNLLVIMQLDHVIDRLSFSELVMKLNDLSMNNLENQLSMRNVVNNPRLT